MTSLVVFVGAGLGGLLRYALGGWVQESSGSTFPWGTLVINVSGSVALALVYAVLEGTRLTPQYRAFIGIGILGGYTTFSTFSYEAMRLLQDAQWGRAGAYVLASVAGSLAGALVGFRIGVNILSRG